jgi:hypothetical protein
MLPGTKNQLVQELIQITFLISVTDVLKCRKLPFE